MQEAIKNLQITTTFLAKWSNVMWDIFCSYQRRTPSGRQRGVSAPPSLWGFRLNMWEPKDKDYIAWGANGYYGWLFSKYGHISPVISKAVIATGDIVLQVTMTWKNFLDILDTLICRSRSIVVIVEDRRPHAGLVASSVIWPRRTLEGPRDYITAAKDAFPELRTAQMESTELKNI